MKLTLTLTIDEHTSKRKLKETINEVFAAFKAQKKECKPQDTRQITERVTATMKVAKYLPISATPL